MKRVLITGIAGFVGSHLADSLKGRAEVWGTQIDGNFTNLSSPDGLNLIKCDLLDPRQVLEAVEKASPQAVFHLAGQSAPSISFANPAETLRTNIFSTLNLFEAIAGSAPEAVIVNVGSGEEYGEAEVSDLPVKETAELKPLNPYAVSKVTQDLLAFQYFRSKRLKIVRCRPFNHYGPRQAATFVSAAFARQIAEIEEGVRREKVMTVGNLESSKDFLYVKDVVGAYELLCEKGAWGEVYNICSGSPVKVREMLDVMLSLSTEKIEVVQDPAKMRPTDSKVLYGDAGKLKSLGWSPEYGLKEGLKGLLDYWRRRVRQEKDVAI